MAGLTYKTEHRAFGFDQTKTKKYVATAQRGGTIEFEKVVEQVALISGQRKATCRAVIECMVEAAGTWMLEGHGVSVGSMGYLKPAITSKASTEKGGETIIRKRVLFVPSKAFKALIETMKVSQVGDTDDAENEAPEAGGGDTPEDGGTNFE